MGFLILGRSLKQLDSAEITGHANVWTGIPVRTGQKTGTAGSIRFSRYNYDECRLVRIIKKGGG